MATFTARGQSLFAGVREAATSSYYLPVAVLSYGWLAKGHPDPEGVLLQKLLPALKAMEKEGVIIGIVWDFVSLPQRGYTTGYDPERDDRTEYERKRFVRGLSAVNIWYRSAYVTTLVCDFDEIYAGAENPNPIDKRGGAYSRRAWAGCRRPTTATSISACCPRAPRAYGGSTSPTSAGRPASRRCPGSSSRR